MVQFLGFVAPWVCIGIVVYWLVVWILGLVICCGFDFGVVWVVCCVGWCLVVVGLGRDCVVLVCLWFWCWCIVA